MYNTQNDEPIPNEPSLGSMIPKPWSLRWQAQLTLANYLLNTSLWTNVAEEGLQWQGIWGLRWLGGGGVRGVHGAVGRGILGRSIFGQAAAYPGQLLGKAVAGVVQTKYGEKAAEAFMERGGRGLLEYLEKKRYLEFIKKGGNAAEYSAKYTNSFLYKFFRLIAGGEDVKLIGVRQAEQLAGEKGGVLITRGARAVARKPWLAGEMRIFRASPKTLKWMGRAAKAANVVGDALILAEIGWTVGKITGTFALRQTEKLVAKLHNLRKTDVYLAPQLMNKYSLTMRQRALQELHSSFSNPSNFILGNEARYMHR